MIDDLRLTRILSPGAQIANRKAVAAFGICSSGHESAHLLDGADSRRLLQTALANFPQTGYSQAMNWKLLTVTLVALVWSCLAFCGEIHDAARDGDLEKVKALLKDNPDLVNSKNTNGLTPLHFAAYSGHVVVVKLLLDNMADVNVTNKSGMTPLSFAVDAGHRDVAELLLTNKAEVDTKGLYGMTPLSDAAGGGDKEMVKLLLANKADVNSKDRNGYTPLHNAAIDGQKEVVELLLANKADVNAKDNQGRTPLDLSVAIGHKNVTDLLRQHGGHE
jgi:ankyrin repeat protein